MLRQTAPLSSIPDFDAVCSTSLPELDSACRAPAHTCSPCIIGIKFITYISRQLQNLTHINWELLQLPIKFCCQGVRLNTGRSQWRGIRVLLMVVSSFHLRSQYYTRRSSQLWFFIYYTQDAKFLLGTGSLNLTPEERRVFGQLFRQADTEGIGVVTGEVAVKFFEKTKLEPRILGEVSSPELYIRITSFRKGRRFRKNEC